MSEVARDESDGARAGRRQFRLQSTRTPWQLILSGSVYIHELEEKCQVTTDLTVLFSPPELVLYVLSEMVSLSFYDFVLA